MSLDGKSHEEIAQTLNISVNTVKKHKNNANHYMRERLKNVLSLTCLDFLRRQPDATRFTNRKNTRVSTTCCEITRPLEPLALSPSEGATKGRRKVMIVRAIGYYHLGEKGCLTLEIGYD